MAGIVGGVIVLAIGIVMGRGMQPKQLSEVPLDPDALAIAIADRLEASRANEIDRIAGTVATRIQNEPAGEAEMAAGNRESAIGADGSRLPAPGSRLPAAEQPPAPIAFDPPVLDFGAVAPDTELRDTILVRNVGDRPLRIKDMATDCRCTTVRNLRGTILAPGGSVEMTAVVEPRSYPGEKKSRITLVFDDYAPAQVEILSDVVRAVKTEPAYINALQELTGTLHVSSKDGSPFRILAVNGGLPRYAGDFDPSPPGGRGEVRDSYKLSWDFSDYDPADCTNSAGEPMRAWWVIETDHPDAPIVDVRVRHECVRPAAPAQGRKWVISERRAIVGAIAPGESKTITVRVEWLPNATPDDNIRSVVSESEQFDAELLQVTRTGSSGGAAGGTGGANFDCELRITPRPGISGLLYGDVRIEGYRAGHSDSLTIIGRVGGDKNQQVNKSTSQH